MLSLISLAVSTARRPAAIPDLPTVAEAGLPGYDAGVPVIDYATGTMGAFALSAALYQSLRTGKGQYIDMAMLDVAMILQSSHITDYFHSGKHHKRAGNRMRFAENSMHEAANGLVQLAASNPRQHRRFYQAIDEPAEAHRALLHRHESVPGVGKPVTVPLAAFKFAHGGPSIERPPARVGEHTDAVLASLGYSAAEIAALRASGAAG